jgi:hypothetical protein
VRISHFVARMFFRGIYFPQMSKMAWIRLLLQNRKTIFQLGLDGFRTWRATRRVRETEVIAVPTS